MNKGITCGIGAACHINNEYIFVFFFISFSRNKSRLDIKIKKNIFINKLLNKIYIIKIL